MKELLKKVMFTGLGIVSMTKDKIEELAKKVSKEAEFSEEEGKKFYQELVEKSEEAKKNLQKQIDETVDAALKKLGAARTEDLKKLEDRIAALEQK